MNKLKRIFKIRKSKKWLKKFEEAIKDRDYELAKKLIMQIEGDSLYGVVKPIDIHVNGYGTGGKRSSDDMIDHELALLIDEYMPNYWTELK